MSRAKANWLRAFNKVRMQLQEVSGTVSPCPHSSTATMEATPTTEAAPTKTCPSAHTPARPHSTPFPSSTILYSSFHPLPNKSMLTTHHSQQATPTQPQKTTPTHTQQYHTHHHKHSSIAPLQTDVRVPASTLVALSDALALHAGPTEAGLPKSVMVRIGGPRLEKPCKESISRVKTEVRTAVRGQRSVLELTFGREVLTTCRKSDR